MMPTVRDVIRASICAGLMVKVTGSTSQNTTRPPAWVIIAEVEIQEWAVVMTSSPGFTPSALTAIMIASVPLAHDTQKRASAALAHARSNASTWLPSMYAESAITLLMAASISSLMVKYCAWRSTNGTFTVESTPFILAIGVVGPDCPQRCGFLNDSSARPPPTSSTNELEHVVDEAPTLLAPPVRP